MTNSPPAPHPTILERRSAASRKAARTRAVLAAGKAPTCARCDAPRLPTGGYCREHRKEYRRARHAELREQAARTLDADYQREWRRKQTRDFRANVRSLSRKDKRFGRLQQQPCTVCGAAETEFHHPDHEMSKLTVWMCRRCHLLWHEHWKSTVLNVFCEWLEVARMIAAVGAADPVSEPRRIAS